MLRVCDNKPDGWGVRAYLYRISAGFLVVTGRDACVRRPLWDVQRPRRNLHISDRRIVEVCLYQGDQEKDCRRGFWP